MALQMHCSLVGREFSPLSCGRIMPLSRLSRQRCHPNVSSFGNTKDRSFGKDRGSGCAGRDWELGHQVGRGVGSRFEHFACGAKLGDQVSCEHFQSLEEPSSGFGMAGFLKVLRSFSVGGDGDCSCPASQGLWRKFSAALLCSCVVVTPGMASPVAAVESVPVSDFLAALVTLGGALGILQFFDELAKRDLLEKKLSRKLCHILSGLVFMLFWPFFSSAPLAKYMAAFAPFANGVRMIGLGLGFWRNETLVKAISREGGQRELLHGPLYYAITITIATLCFWRNSPIGATAVATLCAGDGFADIVGRKYGTRKLPYNSSKSYIGSVAFFVFASLAAMGYVAYFSAFGFFTATVKMYLATVGVTLISAVAESLPLPLDDNFTVPFTAIGVGMLLLPY